MIRLKSGVGPFVIQQYHDALTEQGIGCVLRNQFISGAAGELPVQDLEPELWLLNVDDARQAEAVWQSLQADSQAVAWVCEGCQEYQDAEFNICWNCQQPR
ncbi:putative signal transducing protein [Alteromonas gilva]|uniref:DUF2007 domain-containing protein n=1 Tax=Alteromonas gilva TaxID=2987522 RepID=A0ABT5L9B2_9ALTE|nr:DUF2007 domain-containing protein [Alteromonas gilva]MDC8832598.1 DUF2007 domain-containing protein [Alteromonas gilva]